MTATDFFIVACFATGAGLLVGLGVWLAITRRRRLDPDTWHDCLDAVREAAIAYMDEDPPRQPDVGEIIIRLRGLAPRRPRHTAVHPITHARPAQPTTKREGTEVKGG